MAIIVLAASFTGRSAAPAAQTLTATPSASQNSRDSKPASKKASRQAKDKAEQPVTRAATVGRRMPGRAASDAPHPGALAPQHTTGPMVITHPHEDRMQRGKPFDGDVRYLPQTMPLRRERPEREPPPVRPVALPGSAAATTAAPPTGTATVSPDQSGTQAQSLNVQAPGPAASFEGLDYANWGAGHPPDTNGDVGPTYYIETVNTSIGIYNKSTGTRVAAFTFDTFMSQGQFGNLCDTDNFGDPVVLYDSFEDRWLISDFAFQLDSSQNVVNPPGSFQCFAVSKSGDPVSGGWNFYSINTTGGLGDYPKFGIWPDGIYMSVNMFDYAATGSFQNVRVYAFNKAQMYAGAPTVQQMSFDLPTDQFTVLPANARLQAGTPPAGSPNYFATVWNYLNAISIWKFHVDWNSISTSTFTGPFDAATSTWWAQYGRTVGGQTVDTAPSPANDLDTLYPRLMHVNQYSNIGGVESVWNSHTVGAGNPTTNVTSTQSAIRYYQVKVTGGNVESTATQSYTYSPDTTLFRFMPSAAVDKLGNLAIGYSGSNSTTNPVIDYAGRLAGDVVNTITQTEQTLIAGTGSQSGSCSGTCQRWGDYSAMSLDPDGCTFWYTQEYYQVTGLNDNTRIGAFRLPGCTQNVIQTGTIQGTVTSNGVQVSGATVMLGAGRSTTTNGSGSYSFSSIPAGTYPTMSASYPGLNAGSASNVVITSGGTTTQNFSLTAASVSGCFTDTTQTDFQLGVPSNRDLTTSPGNVTLVNSPVLNLSVSDANNTGFNFSSTSLQGQTFTPTVTGQLTRLDAYIFCASCSGTNPNIIAEVRTTSSGIPVMTAGGLLASATIPGSSDGAGSFMAFQFSTPPSLASGTQYAFVLRLASNRTTGTQDALVTSGDVYAGGRRYVCSTSACSTPTGQNANSDIHFHTYMQAGFASSGTFISSAKDANPAPGATPSWATLSWNATVPANTTLRFQAAASNNAAGPFNFVGPDGTVNTYFTSGASLSQFNGKRYLKYEAFFTSSDSTKTPTLNDVTVCFTDSGSIAATSLAVPAASGTYGGTVNLSATLAANSTGVSGKTVSFTVNGTGVGSTTTNASGVAALSNVSLSGVNAGTYTNGVSASFAGDSSYSSSSGSGDLTVNKANQTITFGALPNKFYGDPDFNVSASTSSGLTVSFGASGQCTVTGTLVHLAAPGSCTITASQAGNTNYNAATNVPQSFTIYTAPAVISQSGWSLLSVDSQELACGNYAATNAFDGDPNTFWLTQYCPNVPMPHQISIDLGAVYAMTGFTYLSRQDASNNGFIAQYEFYVSSDGVNWGTAVSTGSLWQSAADFTTKSTPKQVSFSMTQGRYVRLRALSEASGNPWAAAAELNVIGSLVSSGPAVTGLTLNPTSVVGGNTSTATVTLSGPALTGGQTVQLSSKNIFAATVAASTTVPAGQTSTTFTVNTLNVTANTSATISAGANGGVVTAVLTVNAGAAGAPVIPQDAWTLWSVDSQEISCGNYGATQAFDGNPATFWVTQYCPTSPAPPHDLQIDLGATYQINGFQYLPRQDGSPYGNIGQYEFYVSSDGSSWGTPAASGYLMLSNSDSAQKQVTFPTVTGRYVRLRALAEVSGRPWTAVAEIGVLGTLVNTGPTVTSLAVNPNAIVGGSSTTGTVTLSGAAPSNVTVLLKSNNTFAATVPATVTVLQGQSSATFPVSSVTVSANTQVTLSASANGGTSTATLTVMTVGTSDSLIPENFWSVLSYDSQETGCGHYPATNAIDGDPSTFWISSYCPVTPLPHYVAIDLGGTYAISGFQYLPRQDGTPNGNISAYHFFVSSDGVNWGTAVVQGYLITNASDFSLKQVTFAPVQGRYIKLQADSEVKGNAWSAIAEIGAFGTLVNTGPTVTSVALNPTSVPGGSTSTATITLSAPAGAGGQVVQLSSKNTFVATVPASVVVPQGSTTADFTVSTYTVTGNSSALIAASSNGGLSSTTLTVTPSGSSGTLISHTGWSILYVDSQETSCGNYAAANAIDGNPATFWVTQYCPNAPMPHDIEIDLGTTHNVGGFQYLPRQDGSPNGNISRYQFFVSSDGVNWGSPVADGYLMTTTSDSSLKQVLFPAVSARYVRLHAVNEVNGNPWAEAAEINVINVP